MHFFQAIAYLVVTLSLIHSLTYSVTQLISNQQVQHISSSKIVRMFGNPLDSGLDVQDSYQDGPVRSQKALSGLVGSCMVPYSIIWSVRVWYGPLWSCMYAFGSVWSCMDPYGLVWYRMVPPQSPMWLHMAPLVLYSPLWSRMVLYGPKLFSMVLFGPICFCRVPCGPVWSLIFPYGPVWSRLVLCLDPMQVILKSQIWKILELV